MENIHLSIRLKAGYLGSLDTRYVLIKSISAK